MRPVAPARHAVALARDGEQSCRAMGQRDQRGVWEIMGSVHRKYVKGKEIEQFHLRTNKRSLNTHTTVVVSLIYNCLHNLFWQSFILQ